MRESESTFLEVYELEKEVHPVKDMEKISLSV